MSRAHRIAAAAACALVCVSSATFAAGEPVTVHWFVSTAYGYNFQRPPSETNAFRVFDAETDGFVVDVIEAVAERVASAEQRGGFRVDLTAGSSIPHVAAARGLFRSVDDGTAEDVDLQQAFVTYAAPVGRGLRLDAGKFVTPLGYEVIEGYDNYDQNATRSFLFGYAIPFTHTGVKAAYPISPRASAALCVVNGWDNATDNNRAKSLIAQLTLTPASNVSVTAGAVTGEERDDDVDGVRQVLDLVAMWAPTGALSLGANYDAGREAQPSTVPGLDDETWHGGAAYVRVRTCDALALHLRGEWFSDPQGARTGVVQTLHEVTLTPEYALAPGLVLRGDLRYDWSSVDAFADRTGPTDHQFTARANVLAVF